MNIKHILSKSGKVLGPVAALAIELAATWIKEKQLNDKIAKKVAEELAKANKES